ncbi:MAG TPA: flavodoxin-dependent (E)-4-hydroxy-3-methylbut-2-enyl-diphosphate synthase [Bacillota bacterium]|nr:flavodoxin-dependent (E)-4-hydroxy-3-methylbut-2-enyl-diphosphate synthase [Bacillota bacterium]HPQ02616.1 flavodoxin-dependent (E)-4-hydroxy-3-methylbut-2-enyl-diphosphate synthase [Bacillota bacterium]
MATREETRQVMAGSVPIGGGAPISVQSMTTADTRDADAAIKQIRQLAAVGCEIVRVAVPDEEAADSLRSIRKASSVPLVADIHFNYKLALASIEAGVDKLRINPGNIGGADRVREVAHAAADRGIPIRIGVNAGSLPADLVSKYGRTPEAMVEAALRHVSLLEREGFESIVLSLKASDVKRTTEAYRLIARRAPYPLHVGITEAGPPPGGLIKSAIGIGMVLSEELGDTIRVSLTGDPRDEVIAGREILASLGMRRFGPTIVSCPTCGRCRTDLAGIVREVKDGLSHLDAPLVVAIMGCEVNGPGEASEADVGLACGNGVGLIFSGGRVVRKVREAEMVGALVEAAESMAANRHEKSHG